MFKSLSLIVFYITLSASQEFSYYDQRSWSQLSATCGGRRQSPININTNRVKRDPTLRLNFNGYDKPHRNVLFNNNGHTVRITLNSKSEKPYLRGSAVGIRSDFEFEEMHFHWGRSDFKGSEHSIDDRFGSAELHLVHINRKYGNILRARENSDGIVVLTVVLQLSRADNRAIQTIVRTLPLIRRHNSSDILVNPITLNHFLPENKEIYYRYKGSLTTPPCSEAVTWVILAQPIPISPSQLSQFRLLTEQTVGDRSQRILTNRRHIQRRYGRVVEISTPLLEREDENGVFNPFDDYL